MKWIENVLVWIVYWVFGGKEETSQWGEWDTSNDVVPEYSPRDIEMTQQFYMKMFSDNGTKDGND